MTASIENPLTGRMHSDGSPLDREAYEAAGGYQGIRKVLRGIEPRQVTQQVKDAVLRGRGGAGFSTGTKWSFVPLGPDVPNPTYLVCNADEMEPGTFKDRLLMERDPHQLIEGMMIASYAIEADVAFIFLRNEYRLSAERLSQALSEAYAKNYLGNKIFGSDYSLEMYLHVSAGRYMCGEESGLLNALEGKRANPRLKPPYPTTAGLFGKPTVVNNVETLSCVPHIVNRGAQWFRALSRTHDGGTKLFGVSGNVKNPGLWEAPMGTPVREILEGYAGGMRDGLKFRGLLPGGASTDFIVESDLDLPMDFDGLAKAGSRMGTGTMIVLDDRTCPVGMVHNLMQFFARESCGWCTPCWSGLAWSARLLGAMEEGSGQAGDIEKLEQLAGMWAPGHTFCALAPGAAEPLQSALHHFREDFERHIREKRCPYS
ncbi:MAG TPA: NADH-quinone oxidoreductase subunit NuoF [Bryobacteraceae bacterium]|nr:NADH-quinone oxidoreductase subunit NuoF [Bryobacteraceae bacterium]